MQKQFRLYSSLFCTALVLGALLALLIRPHAPSSAPSAVAHAVAIPIKNIPVEFLDNAFRALLPWQTATGTRIILIPHHMVAAKEIASLVAATPKPSVIYYLAPDHFNTGKLSFSTVNAVFMHEAGNVRTADAAVQDLLRQTPSLAIDTRVFETDPSSLGPMPILARAWPDVPIVPILAHTSVTGTEELALSRILAERLKNDPDALFVSSVDFSHEAPPSIAKVRDVASEKALRSLDADVASKLYLDAPSVFAVTMQVAQSLSLNHVTIHAHTHSAEILHAHDDRDSTSHFYASFAPLTTNK